ncbi:DUF4810 domain-containing protein [Pseudoduganella violaceinigra]|uniref:DUF4810 domain-containing protein n=1 Tax=Pseudoduganella violaceinigra TaxID=246602 RepID=UPI00040F3697|nr:DUF4810 domain-containing protein [Pseudoduganella violaceinigra]
MKYRVLIAVAVLAALAGCSTAPTTKYDWGTYEQSLYEHYKKPADMPAITAALSSTINNAEKNNRAVPPGLYAEYGYLMLQQNRLDEAQVYFIKEKNKWPESTVLMDRMIKLAQSKPASAQGVQQ